MDKKLDRLIRLRKEVKEWIEAAKELVLVEKSH